MQTIFLNWLQSNQLEDSQHLQKKNFLIVVHFLMYYNYENINFLIERKAIYGTHSSVNSEYEETCLKLKGQMLYVKEWDAVIFLAIPVYII
jgi:hypothetical protein